MKTKSELLGKSTSAEVAHISPHGIWLLIKEQEYFLGFTDYPWFEEAKVADIHQLELLHDHHLRWESLDVDIELATPEAPQGIPAGIPELRPLV